MSPSATAVCRFLLPKSTNSEATATQRVTRHGHANRPAVRAAGIATCDLPVSTSFDTTPAASQTAGATSDAVLSGRVNAVLALRPSPPMAKRYPASMAKKCRMRRRWREISAWRETRLMNCARDKGPAKSGPFTQSKVAGQRWKRSSRVPNKLPKNENAGAGRCMRTGACRVVCERSIAM